MDFNFRQQKSAPGEFEAVHLPDDQKLALVENLLGELGVDIARVRGDEVIHGCPLPWARHQDQVRNPTASINYRKLVFHCLGCGSSGGLLWFIASMRGEGVTKQQARQWVESRTGTSDDPSDFAALMQYFDSLYAEKSYSAPVIPTYDERVLTPWLAIHPYMTEIRGCREDVLKAHRVGYAANYRISEHLTSERIVLPHFWEGKLVGWQTRRLIKDGSPKYLASPDFPKDTTLYDYSLRADRVVVVESVLSVLNKGHAIRDLVATFGAAVTDRQTKLLSRIPHVILWFDNDEAGWKATEQVAERLIDFTLVSVVESPWAGDIANLPDEEALRLLEDPVPFSDWRRPYELKPWGGEQSGDHQVRNG